MRIIRLVSGTILPPFLGALVLLSILVIERGSTDWPAIAGGWVLFLIFSFCFMILPSVGYSLAMEFLGTRMKKRIISYLMFSGLLGMCAAWMRFNLMPQDDLNYVLVTGGVTGILTGMILRRLHTLEANLYIWKGSDPDGGINSVTSLRDSTP